MDISEYEAIQENKRLLQDSLDRERKLQDELERLNKEKIQALEDAKMKVVKTIKSETTEHILVRRDFRDKFYQIQERIFNVFASNKTLNNPISQVANGFLQYEIEQLIDIYFEKEKSYSLSQPEITTHGLDEVKAELREEIKKELSATYNKDMELVRDAKNELTQKQMRITDLEKNISNLEDVNRELIKELSDKTKVIEECKEDISKKSESISTLKKLSQIKHNFFNSKFILSEIKKEIGSWAE